MMEPERNGRLGRCVESCGTACTGESMDNSGVYGVAVSVSDELEACKTVQMGDDLTISALGSSTIVAEESSASCLAPSSFVLGLGVTEQIPLAHPVAVDDTYDDALYRRVNDGSVIFETSESHTTSNIGLFKAIKGNSDFSSPIQNQNPDLTLLLYPKPVTESCHAENTLSVFKKLKVKYLCIEGTTLTLCEELEEVDYKHPYRHTDWHKGQCIGSGASGTCFLYTNRCSDHVVLKQVPVCANNRAKLECVLDVMRSIRHKNITPFITSNEVHGYFNIVMEYVAGLKTTVNQMWEKWQSRGEKAEEVGICKEEEVREEAYDARDSAAGGQFELVREVVGAIANNEYMERNIAHIMMVGFPRSGKSSLMDNLLGKQREVYSSTGVCDSAVVVDIDIIEPTTLNAAMALDSDDCAWKPVECNASFLVQVQKCKELAETTKGKDDASQNNAALMSQKNSSSAQDVLNSRQLAQDVSLVLKNYEIKSFKDLKKSSSIYLRDTGGQLEFQEILTILIYGPSIFFFVFNTSIPFNKELTIKYKNGRDEILNEYKSSISTEQALIQTLASIYAMQTTESVTIKMHKPLVFIVGTHTDKLVPHAAIKIAAINKSLDELITRYGFEDLVKYKSKEDKSVIYPVNNKSAINTDFKELRSGVNKVVTETKCFSIKYPVSYLLFCLELQNINRSILTRKECAKMAARYGIKGDVEVLRLLHFLHYRIGNIRYYNVDGLRHLVVKEPQVLFNKLTELIVKTFPSSSALFPDELKEFEKGILEASVFERILGSEDKMTPKEFLLLLVHLRIVVSFKDKKGIEKYFIPAVLNHIPESTQEEIKTDILPLVVAFKCHHCPKGLYGMLVAHLMVPNKNKVKDGISLQLLEDKIFKDQVAFAVRMNDECDIISLKMHSSNIQAKFYPEASEKDFHGPALSLVCNAVRLLIEESIVLSLKELHYDTEKVQPEICSWCPDCHQPHPVQESKERPSIHCFKYHKKIYLPAEGSCWYKTIPDVCCLPTLVDRMRTVVKEAPAEEEWAEGETVSTKVASTQTPEAGGNGGTCSGARGTGTIDTSNELASSKCRDLKKKESQVFLTMVPKLVKALQFCILSVADGCVSKRLVSKATYQSLLEPNLTKDNKTRMLVVNVEHTIAQQEGAWNEFLAVLKSVGGCDNLVKEMSQVLGTD